MFEFLMNAVLDYKVGNEGEHLKDILGQKQLQIFPLRLLSSQKTTTFLCCGAKIP